MTSVEVQRQVTLTRDRGGADFSQIIAADPPKNLPASGRGADINAIANDELSVPLTSESTVDLEGAALTPAVAASAHHVRLAQVASRNAMRALREAGVPRQEVDLTSLAPVAFGMYMLFGGRNGDIGSAEFLG